MSVCASVRSRQRQSGVGWGGKVIQRESDRERERDTLPRHTLNIWSALAEGKWECSLQSFDALFFMFLLIASCFLLSNDSVHRGFLQGVYYIQQQIISTTANKKLAVSWSLLQFNFHPQWRSRNCTFLLTIFAYFLNHKMCLMTRFFSPRWAYQINS